MDVVAEAKRIVAQAADLITALRLGRDRLYAERERARHTCAASRALRAPSLHDLMPLDLAAAVIFRRVYGEHMPLHSPTRLSAHLDGLAYTIAELAPIYVYQRNGGSVRPLSREELAGALFQGGAKTISYIDGRAALADLALNARQVEALIHTLVASSNVSRDA
jgi:hypothetical protein